MIEVTTGRGLPWRRESRFAACAFVLSFVLGGCASTGGSSTATAVSGASASASPPPSSPPPAAANASAPPSQSFTSRVKALFSGDSSDLASPPAKPNADFDCPSAEQRQGAATYTVNQPGTDPSALTVRYQASFSQIARECIVRGNEMTIKVGVEGHIVVGPAGGPGQVSIPLRYALVREGLEAKVIWTKLYLFPVTIPEGEQYVPFINIEEEMTATIPRKVELENYVVYVGFDPDGVPAAKPAAKPRTARSR